MKDSDSKSDQLGNDDFKDNVEKEHLEKIQVKLKEGAKVFLTCQFLKYVNDSLKCGTISEALEVIIKQSSFDFLYVSIGPRYERHDGLSGTWKYCRSS